MTAASSIFLIAVGAIIRYAIDVDIAGVDLETVGLILMIAGFAGLLFSIAYLFMARDRQSGTRPPDDRRPPPGR